MNDGHDCPLCAGHATRTYTEWHDRLYLICTDCDLVWRHPAQRMAPEAERRYYATHENDPDDPGYRHFLTPALRAALAGTAPGACALDYGCGPASALAAMLGEHGYTVALYDPCFAPDPEPLTRAYDLVTCTETVEHFHVPGREFSRLSQLLKPGGVLVVMTAMRPPLERFHGWHYVRDPTHVCFYTPATMRWIAGRHHLELRHPDRNVTLFRKTS